MKSKILIWATVVASVFIISVMLLPAVLADPTNETADVNITDDDDDWYDSQWGGDTGNDEYTEPIVDNGTRSEPGFFDDICGSTFCTTSFLGAVCIPTYYIQRKKKKESKL